ncbi:unnamed protein product [Rangifer tarandus platyrhynchus]|uniref:Uncharacterized protein n=1 Tax=Rangifer tarandus platyrhynchus TaxID=3082113 RepID=A0AC59Y991_RANTA
MGARSPSPPRASSVRLVHAPWPGSAPVPAHAFPDSGGAIAPQSGTGLAAKWLWDLRMGYPRKFEPRLRTVKSGKFALLRTLGCHQTAQPGSPSPAPLRQPAIGRCKYQVLCPATGDAPPDREAWPGRSPSGHLGVYTGRPRARRSGPQTARGRGGARAGGAARGERHWKAAGWGAARAGRSRAGGCKESPPGPEGCRSSAPRKTMYGVLRGTTCRRRRGRAEPA